MSSKQRNLRKKRDREEASDSEEPGVEVKKDYLEDLKAVQKLRKRTAGINAGALASGQSSGDADAQAAAEAAASMADNELMDAYVRAQGAKSALQDEEAHMQQFVERELAKRLGKDLNDGAQQLSKHELEEQELYAVPEAFKGSLTKEVSIPGLMSTITEVEMSKEAKMKKIEETEAMKQKMLARGMSSAGGSGEGEGPARRRDFVVSFGKQKPKTYNDADEAEEKARQLPKFISERKPFPKTGLPLKGVK